MIGLQPKVGGKILWIF